MTSMLLLPLLGGLAALAGRGFWRQRRRALVARQRRGQLPEALERMAGALRTGSSLPQALTDAGHTVEAPLGPELAELAQMTDAGQPLLDTLDRWATNHGDSGTQLAATALALATHIGAAPARALDGVATTLRDRISLAGERHAQAAQARYSAIVLSVAPLGFTGLLITTNGTAAHFLLATPLGWACLLVGLGLDALGAAWMARLTQADPDGSRSNA